MSAETRQSPQIDNGPIDPIESAVRWTLGNLEQAFDQAVDEAFQTCTTLLHEFGSSPADANPRAGRCETPAEAVRFHSCEGPIADGEPGEGLGPARRSP